MCEPIASGSISMRSGRPAPDQRHNLQDIPLRDHGLGESGPPDQVFVELDGHVFRLEPKLSEQLRHGDRPRQLATLAVQGDPHDRFQTIFSGSWRSQAVPPAPGLEGRDSAILLLQRPFTNSSYRRWRRRVKRPGQGRDSRSLALKLRPIPIGSPLSSAMPPYHGCCVPPRRAAVSGLRPGADGLKLDNQSWGLLLCRFLLLQANASGASTDSRIQACYEPATSSWFRSWYCLHNRSVDSCWSRSRQC